MDRRLQHKQNGSANGSTEKVTLTDQELNDSLIFNIMKKIQTRERLIEDYNQEKQRTNKNILTKYFIHSKIPVYYGLAIFLTKMYKIIHMKPGTPASTVITVPNLLFHVCVFLSLNEYQKYKNIFFLKHELGEEYQIYKRNVDTLMQQKMNQFSLLKKISQTQYLNQDRLVQVFKYRLVV